MCKRSVQVSGELFLFLFKSKNIARILLAVCLLLGGNSYLLAQLPNGIDAVTPAQNATGVSTSTDLIIDLTGDVHTISVQQYASASGFKLYKTTDLSSAVYTYIFKNNTDIPWVGSDIITFNDVPTLDANTEYTVVAGYGWVRTTAGNPGGFLETVPSWNNIIVKRCGNLPLEVVEVLRPLF